MYAAGLAGFALGFSLILAIGAQNAFVLRQGLRREHIFAVCLTCAISDAILIAAGVAGFGVLVKAIPELERYMRLGGAIFLFWYGVRNFLAAWRGGEVMERTMGTGSLKTAVLTCLALAWLNPHVYLDTVVLLGSLSAQYENRIAYALGAMLASFVFFFGLGYGARILDPIFQKPASWRILDLIIGLIMWSIALALILG